METRLHFKSILPCVTDVDATLRGCTCRWFERIWKDHASCSALKEKWRTTCSWGSGHVHVTSVGVPVDISPGEKEMICFFLSKTRRLWLVLHGRLKDIDLEYGHITFEHQAAAIERENWQKQVTTMLYNAEALRAQYHLSCFIFLWVLGLCCHGTLRLENLFWIGKHIILDHLIKHS